MKDPRNCTNEEEDSKIKPFTFTIGSVKEETSVIESRRLLISYSVQ